MDADTKKDKNNIIRFSKKSSSNGGQFVDVKITDVFANSLRGELVRTEKDMDLRTMISPTQMMAKTKREDELGVATFTP